MPQARRTRILIVDDNEDNRMALAGLLAIEGYEVAVAADGDEAIRAQEVRPFDVVVTDIFMPVMDGLETISQFHERYPETPIIAMSGAHPVSVDYLSLSLEFGATSILRKPFDVAVLKAAVQDALAGA